MTENYSVSDYASFRLMGIEIGSWHPTLQYLFITSGVMIFLLLYGYLQELVVMNKFKRSLGWFVTLLQLSGYALCAATQNIISQSKHERRIPVGYYIIFSVLQVIMQGLTNLSMHYLNYPAKTLFKSSRVIMTMLFGILILGRRYHLRDHAVALSMVVGLTIFVAADAHTSPEFDIAGVVLIMLAICADAAILNLQEHCLRIFNARHDELVYYSNVGAAIVAFFMTISAGELLPGIAFLNVIGSVHLFLLFLAFSLAGFLGLSCLAALTKKFGALASAITSVLRKAFTLLLSYILFPDHKTFTPWHFLGAFIFMGGLLIKSVPSRHHKGGINAAKSTSPHHHPHQHHRHHPEDTNFTQKNNNIDTTIIIHKNNSKQSFSNFNDLEASYTPAATTTSSTSSTSSSTAAAAKTILNLPPLSINNSYDPDALVLDSISTSSSSSSSPQSSVSFMTELVDLDAPIGGFERAFSYSKIEGKKNHTNSNSSNNSSNNSNSKGGFSTAKFSTTTANNRNNNNKRNDNSNFSPSRKNNNEHRNGFT